MKHAIAHAEGEDFDISAAIANMNSSQRLNKTGSASELFFNRATRLPGLLTIPTHMVSNDQEKDMRAKTREQEKMRSMKRRRSPDTFDKGEIVWI